MLKNTLIFLSGAAVGVAGFVYYVISTDVPEAQVRDISSLKQGS